ncbi:MAG TPA: phosphate ABC transporter substrate-binding protein PstS [Planktothrix sp.]|jgi:phosphate transport system substrate-binding protein
MRKTATFILTLGCLVTLVGCSQSNTPAQQEADDFAKVQDVQTSFTSLQGLPTSDTKELDGKGGTFPVGLYMPLWKQYRAHTGVNVKYAPEGSGQGISTIQNQEGDFGASDAAMSNDQLAQAKGGELLHIPTAFGAIAVAYNIPNLQARLKLTGDQLAGIYIGAIRYWDDPALVSTNPELSGRHEMIIAVHRGDNSGTTFGFTSFLSSNASWRSSYGTGTALYWPVGLGVAGNDGVAAALAQNPYSIGYTDLNFAAKKKIATALVKNSSGNFIEPTLDSVTASVLSAIPSGLDLRLNLINTSGKESYPITTATYIIVYKNQSDKNKGTALAGMLWWMTHDGQSVSKSLLYAPVPPALTAKSEQLIREINFKGQPLVTKQ